MKVEYVTQDICRLCLRGLMLYVIIEGNSYIVVLLLNK